VSAEPVPSILDGTLAVTPRVFALVAGIVTERNAHPAYQDRSFYLDDAGSLGEGEERRLAMRGGFWNARDATRILDGFTIADATALRRSLREIGFSVTRDEADALLAQCERGILRTMATAKATAPAPSTDARLASYRKANATRRERARRNGWCVICLVDPDRDGARRPKLDKLTCKVCQDRANASLAARRKSASAAKTTKKPAKKRGRNATTR
jgi:hypothetical protein